MNPVEHVNMLPSLNHMTEVCSSHMDSGGGDTNVNFALVFHLLHHHWLHYLHFIFCLLAFFIFYVFVFFYINLIENLYS